MSVRCARLWQVEAAADRRLTGSELASFERHVARCSECRKEASELHRFQEGMRAAVSAPPVSPFQQRRQRQDLLRRADELITGRKTKPRSRSGNLYWLVGPALAAGATAVAMWLPQSPVDSPREPRTATAAASSRELDAAAVRLGTHAASHGQAESRSTAPSRAHERIRSLEPQTSALQPPSDRVPPKPGPELAVRAETKPSTSAKSSAHSKSTVTAKSTAATKRTARLPTRPRPGDVPATEPSSPELLTANTPSKATPTAVHLFEASSPELEPSIPAAPSEVTIAVSNTLPSTAQAALSVPAAADPGAQIVSRQGGELFGMAIRAFSKDELVEAERLLQLFAKHFPHDPRAEDAAFLAAVARQRLGDRRGAARAAKSYLEAYPRGFRAGEAKAILTSYR